MSGRVLVGLERAALGPAEPLARVATEMRHVVATLLQHESGTTSLSDTSTDRVEGRIGQFKVFAVEPVRVEAERDDQSRRPVTGDDLQRLVERGDVRLIRTPDREREVPRGPH